MTSNDIMNSRLVHSRSAGRRNCPRLQKHLSKESAGADWTEVASVCFPLSVWRIKGLAGESPDRNDGFTNSLHMIQHITVRLTLTRVADGRVWQRRKPRGLGRGAAIVRWQCPPPPLQQVTQHHLVMARLWLCSACKKKVAHKTYSQAIYGV